MKSLDANQRAVTRAGAGDVGSVDWGLGFGVCEGAGRVTERTKPGRRRTHIGGLFGRATRGLICCQRACAKGTELSITLKPLGRSVCKKLIQKSSLGVAATRKSFQLEKTGEMDSTGIMPNVCVP